jgi:hypothetical protein
MWFFVFNSLLLQSCREEIPFLFDPFQGGLQCIFQSE